ncbi:MAG: molybdate ABC transporter permease subunit [Actinomycetia bacterium]|nr:molybdate ABC transporter permease subunit [Actinomycetes bacterium]
MPWSGLGELLGRRLVVDALGVSAVVSLSAAALAFVLGVPLAHLLAHHDFRGRSVVRAVVLLPMVLPPVVGGVALLFALGRRGLVGQWLDRWFGLALPFTTAGAIVAATFVALPFLVVTVEGALRSRDQGLEEAAAMLGAGPLTRFTRVTVPAIRPALIGGVALAWARALGEFGATITFAGNFERRTQTLPLATFLALEQDPEAALALSLVLLAISFTILITLRDRWYGTS